MIEFIFTLLDIISSGMIIVPFIKIMIGCTSYHAKIYFTLIFIGFAWYAVNIILSHIFYIGGKED